MHVASTHGRDAGSTSFCSSITVVLGLHRARLHQVLCASVLEAIVCVVVGVDECRRDLLCDVERHDERVELATELFAVVFSEFCVGYVVCADSGYCVDGGVVAKDDYEGGE